MSKNTVGRPRNYKEGVAVWMAARVSPKANAALVALMKENPTLGRGKVLSHIVESYAVTHGVKQKLDTL